MKVLTRLKKSDLIKVKNRELMNRIRDQLKIGDIIFIQVLPLLFDKVSSTTKCWVNHVGIVVSFDNGEPVIAESRFPFSSTTRMDRFISRSKDRKFAIARLKTSLTVEQQEAVLSASNKRMGLLYDTGFNLESRRQFCSRFVREVIHEATGEYIGEIEKFEKLLTKNPEVELNFWTLWYFGQIPWGRQTVTPASIYISPNLTMVIDSSLVS